MALLVARAEGWSAAPTSKDDLSLGGRLEVSELKGRDQQTFARCFHLYGLMRPLMGCTRPIVLVPFDR